MHSLTFSSTRVLRLSPVTIVIEQEVKIMKAIRQGDLLLIAVRASSGRKLAHLTLAEGFVSGHAHRISRGQAELYEDKGALYLKVLSNTAELSHDEHDNLQIPRGHWAVRIQREYVPQKRSASRPQRHNRDSDLAQYLSHQPASGVQNPHRCRHNPKHQPRKKRAKRLRLMMRSFCTTL